MLDKNAPNIDCILLTQTEITESQAREWSLPWPASAGFWYINLDSEIATYCTLTGLGKRTHIPGFLKDHLTSYPIKYMHVSNHLAPKTPAMDTSS